MKETAQNQKQTFSYIQTLSEQLNKLSSNSKEQDKKLSNFLSTQLNTQSSISQLISQLSKEGLIDSSTKKI